MASFKIQKEWYKIRDMFCGANSVVQNIPMALKLASSCQHPDAQWLAQVCAEMEVKTNKEAECVFFYLEPKRERLSRALFLMAFYISTRHYYVASLS